MSFRQRYNAFHLSRRLALLAVLGAVLLSFQNCSPSFVGLTGGTVGLTSNGANGGAGGASGTGAVNLASWPYSGKYLSSAFTLASDSVYASFNADFSSSFAIYVDETNGSDSNPGTSLAPLKTLEAARAAAATLLPTATTHIFVVLRGEFHPAQTLNLTAADSGVNGHFVIYTSDPARPATISGGVLLPNKWTLIDASKNMYALSVGTLQFRDVYVNGVMAARSETASPQLQSTISASGVVNCSSCGLPTVSAAGPVEVVMGSQWQMARCRATLNTDMTATMTGTCPVRALSNNAPPSKIIKLENSRSLMTGAGQWALDRTAGMLYYIPRSGEDLTTARVSVPQLTRLISAQGLQNVAFVGIRFVQTDWEQVNTDRGVVIMQADVYYTDAGIDWIPSSLECTSCKSILVMDSEFANLETSGVRIGAGSSHNLIFHNSFHNIGGSGLQIGSPSSSDPTQAVSGTVVEDNTITNVGQDNFSSPGVFQYFAANSLIQHNDVYNLPYTGISVGWGWTLSAVPNHHDNAVSANHIYNVMNVLQDGGGIYLNAAQAGSSVSHNFVHDVKAGTSGLNQTIFGVGVYLDNGCSGITVNDNSAINITSLPLFLQNIVEPFAENNNVASDGLDELTVRNQSGVRTLPIHPLAPGSYLAFGGMYGFGGDPANPNAEITYPNSVTQGASCPAGYTATQILGTYNVDYPMYYCYRVMPAGSTPDYDFGGTYATGGQMTYVNPLTQASSCPAGYSSHQVLGTTNVDWTFYYCIRPHVAGAANFQGFFGLGFEDSKQIAYAHPLTGLANCPTRSSASQIFGTTGTDYTVFACY